MWLESSSFYTIKAVGIQGYAHLEQGGELINPALYWVMSILRHGWRGFSMGAYGNLNIFFVMIFLKRRTVDAISQRVRR